MGKNRNFNRGFRSVPDTEEEIIADLDTEEGLEAIENGEEGVGVGSITEPDRTEDVEDTEEVVIVNPEEPEEDDANDIEEGLEDDGSLNYAVSVVDLEEIAVRVGINNATTKDLSLISILTDMHNRKKKLDVGGLNKKARDIYNDWFVIIDILTDYIKDNKEDKLTESLNAIKQFILDYEDDTFSCESLTGLLYLLKESENMNQLGLTVYNADAYINIIKYTYYKLTNTALEFDFDNEDKVTALLKKINASDEMKDLLLNKLN